MKKITIENQLCRAEAFDGGRYSLKINVCEGFNIAVGRTACSEMSETSAINSKFRRHDSADGVTVGIDSEGTIPFGCEYTVSRRITLSDGAALITTDAAALNHGTIDIFECENICFDFEGNADIALVCADGSCKTFEYREEEDDDDEKILYSGSKAVVMLSVKNKDAAAEFMISDDIWRYCCKGKSGLFTVKREKNRIILERTPFNFRTQAEENKDDAVTAPKRPWRFNFILMWHSAAKSSTPPDRDHCSIDIDGCALSAANRRKIKSATRSGAGDLVIECSNLDLCCDAAHLERPGRGELLHTAAHDLLSMRIWGNRQRRSGRVFINVPQSGVFSESILPQIVAAPPESIG
jgi:hypothetical protein